MTVKVDVVCYVHDLLPNLVEYYHDLLGDDFAFQQDGPPAHRSVYPPNTLEQGPPLPPPLALSPPCLLPSLPLPLEVSSPYCGWGA